MTLQVTGASPVSIQNSAADSNCLTHIATPWNCEGDTISKIAAWAGFFFVGWIYHPICAISHCYTQICEWVSDVLKINRVAEEIFYSDPISQTLSSFNNARVGGQVNGIYVTTNESRLEASRQSYAAHPRVDGDLQTIHIGCATWHNLDIICARRSTYGLIVDFNPKNGEFMRKTLQMVNTCESRDRFVHTMVDYLNSLSGRERDLYFHSDQQGLPTERIERELEREGSWLQTEENYLYIKQQLAARDRLVAITEDMTHDEVFANIRRFLNNSHIAVDTLYVSNICNFMNTPGERGAFARSVRHLLNNDTLFINCPRQIERNSSDPTLLVQRVAPGREILASAFDFNQLFEVRA